MKSKTPLALFFLVYANAQAATLAGFTFPASDALEPTTVAGNLTVSDLAITSGTISTNITFGSYFPNEPYVQGNSGWTSSTQTGAKAFTITITADPGFEFSIDNVFFRGYATGAGPAAIGFAIGSTNLFAVDAPSSSLVVVDETVSGQTGLTSAVISIQGWDNDSRTTSGGGDFRIDDVEISGTVTAVPEPAIALLGGLGLIGLLRRRR